MLPIRVSAADLDLVIPIFSPFCGYHNCASWCGCSEIKPTDTKPGSPVLHNSLMTSTYASVSDQLTALDISCQIEFSQFHSHGLLLMLTIWGLSRGRIMAWEGCNPNPAHSCPTRLSNTWTCIHSENVLVLNQHIASDTSCQSEPR